MNFVFAVGMKSVLHWSIRSYWVGFLLLWGSLAAIGASTAVAHTTGAERTVSPPPVKQFAAQLVLTEDGDKFISRYQAGQKVAIAGNTVHPLRPLPIMALMSGCTTDVQGLCNVTATFTVHRADGGVLSTLLKNGDPPSRNLPILVNQPPPSEERWHVKRFGGAVEFAPFAPKLSQLGDYLILAVFIDHNRPDTSLTAWQVVHVSESPQAQKVRAEIAASGLSDVDFNPQRLNVLGYEALYKVGDIKKALQYFRWNATLFPEQPEVVDSLAEGYLQAGDRDQALAHYARALKLKPDYGNAVTAKSIVAKLKADPDSLVALQKQAREAYR